MIFIVSQYIKRLECVFSRYDSVLTVLEILLVLKDMQTGHHYSYCAGTKRAKLELQKI